MATIVNKFELTLIPDIRNDTNYKTFQATLLSVSIGTLKYYQVYGSDDNQGLIIHGLVHTGADSASALAALNTLNTALGTPVTCVSYQVAMQS